MSGRRLRRVSACSAVVGLVAAVVVGVRGGDVVHDPAARLVAGTAWLARPSRGEALRVDALTAQVTGRVVVGAPGERIEVVNAGSSALVVNRDRRVAGVVDGRSWTWSERDGTLAPDAAVVAGGSVAWVVSERAAQAWEVEDDRVVRHGPVPTGWGATTDRAVVAGDGMLWALDGGGRLRCTAPADGWDCDREAGRVDRGPGAGPAVRGVVLVGDRPAVVDGGTVTGIGMAGRPEWWWDRGVPGDAVFAATTRFGPVAVSGSTGALYLGVPGGGRGRVVDLGDAPARRAYGRPVELGGRIFVPHRGGGEVIVVDAGSPGGAPRRVALPGGVVDAELLVHDDQVWFQERTAAGAGDGAGVITTDLRALGVRGADGGDTPSPQEGTGPPGDGPIPDDDGPQVPVIETEPPTCARNRPAAQCPPVGPLRPSSGEEVSTRGGCPRRWPTAACADAAGTGGGDTAGPQGRRPRGDRDDPAAPRQSAGRPGAAFTWWPRQPVVGRQVTFTDASTVAHDAARWSFPGADPRESSEPAPVVSWPGTGTFTVTLMIDGPSGRDERSEDITVAAAGEVLVPALVGRTLDEARQLLHRAGLKPGAVGYQRSGLAPDLVAAASSGGREVAENQRLARDSEVDLSASNGRGAAQVAAGGFAGCARFGDGSVACWGQAGLRATGTPAAVPGLTRVTDIDVGTRHACAIQAGRVWCWGDNTYGQVGQPPGRGVRVDEMTTDYVVEPLEVPGLRDAVTLALGADHSCAVRQDGDVLCWGDNRSGQLGDGTIERSPVPRPIPGWHRPAAITARVGVTCVVMVDRLLSCVGDGRDRGFESGLGPSDSGPPDVFRTPHLVGWPVGVLAFDLELGHLCASYSGGKIYCSEEQGLFDIGSEPTAAVSEGDVTQLAVGYDHVCGLVAAGSIVCQGKSQLGALGDGGPTEDGSGRTARVVGIEDAVSISGAADQVCALRRDGSVFCWGNNRSGQLGNGVFGYQSSSPVRVLLP
jgi:PKD repeat protein